MNFDRNNCRAPGYRAPGRRQRKRAAAGSARGWSILYDKTIFRPDAAHGNSTPPGATFWARTALAETTPHGTTW